MDATLYTGTGAGSLVVNNADTGTQGFYPDLIWIKSRNAAYYNTLLDYQRGVAVRLFSNLSDGESNNGCQSSFNTNGFTLNADAGGVNNSGTTYVAWQWNAGSGTSSSNTNGSVTSNVDVNTTAGFSIVKYTLTSASTQTVGHGLSTAPSLVIVKIRNTSGTDWFVYHSALGAGNYLKLNTTGASTTDSGTWNNTAPTSSVFTLGSTWAAAGYPMITYCWAPVAGFSQFGSFVGNGSADGPFVYTGFKPKFILIKATSGTLDWEINDSTRNPYNASNLALYPDLSAAETSTYAYKDFLSNGFKIRTTNGNSNTNGTTYIYAAFAENPFKFSNAA